jgi:hypothetical protein
LIRCTTNNATPSIEKGLPLMAQTKGRPSLVHWMTHIRKTLRLLGTLVTDRRVPVLPKALFFLFVIVFGVVLIIPDSIIIAAIALGANVAAPLVGIPVGVIDVALLATAMYGLLSFFPHDLVVEHSTQLYGPSPDVRPHLEKIPPAPEKI